MQFASDSVILLAFARKLMQFASDSVREDLKQFASAC
jgi:hypothetical protein